jgi:GGDEF domain-containing protein
MDHPSPDPRAGAVSRIVPLVATLGLGLGMGLAATSELPAGSAIAAGSLLLLAGAAVVRRGKRSPTSTAADETPDLAPALVDAETGLPNAGQLSELLRREIARSMRYGDRSALAVFDVRIAGFLPGEGHAVLPPSPARYIAATMLQAARTSDIVARIDTTRFAVVLTECDDNGATLFCERLRTRLGTMPFAHTEDGQGIYVRAWAGMTRWDPAFPDPLTYLGAAIAHMESSRRGYEAAQTYFSGAVAS